MTASIQSRKKDHLKLALSPEAQIGNPGFDCYHFIHNALPELNFDDIDLSTTFLGKKVSYPFFISCMSGGVKEGSLINKRLARAAQKHNIPMGVGSQRIAIEHPELEKHFQVRQFAPDIPLIANIGLIQLNYGYGLREFQKCIDMIGADALAVHLNPLQEAIQPEGDRNFHALLPKLKKILPKLNKPVIAKEVGNGLSESVARRLYHAGVRIIDTAGWGGTNWVYVEVMRKSIDQRNLLFTSWGIPAAESIRQCAGLKSKHSDLTILGSGGVRSGLDIAKAIALGADLVGIATPFAQAALESQSALDNLIARYAHELKLAMFAAAARNIKELQALKL